MIFYIIFTFIQILSIDVEFSVNLDYGESKIFFNQFSIVHINFSNKKGIRLCEHIPFLSYFKLYDILTSLVENLYGVRHK